MQRFSFYVSVIKVPLFLALLFVVQNEFFNTLVHLVPNLNKPFFLFESFTLGVLLFGPAVLFGKRARYLYLFLASLIVSAIFISQYLYFSFFGAFLQASALKYVGQVGAVKNTIATLLSPWLLVFVMNLVAVALFFAFSWAGKVQEIVLPRRKKTGAALVIISIAAFGYGMVLSTEENGWQKLANPIQTLHELNSFTFSQGQTIQKIGICNYYFGDIIGMLFRKTTITEENMLFVENLFSQKSAPAEGKYFGMARGKNLIFVQFESLENSLINQKVDGQEITPNLNRLAKEGLYFNNYYTQVGPGNTADAEFVTLNSLYSLTNTVAFVDFANNRYEALPALLLENGYHTYVLHGDVPSFWNRANIYPKLGYETAISKKDFTVTEARFETLPDDDFFVQSVDKMLSFDRPFMATFITLSSHTPFDIPEAYQTLDLSGNNALTETQKKYLQSIRYSDEALGKFITGLKEKGLYKNSLIAIYGDHGSSTGINDYFGKPGSLGANQVPLIILGTSLKKTVSTPGSHLDLYPTIADLLGIKRPQNIFGQDLLTTKNPVFTRRDPYSQTITDILTPKLWYEYGGDNNETFEEGSCFQMPNRSILPISDCKKIYDTELANVTASDFIVKGNLISRISTASTTHQ